MMLWGTAPRRKPSWSSVTALHGGGESGSACPGQHGLGVELRDLVQPPGALGTERRHVALALDCALYDERGGSINDRSVGGEDVRVHRDRQLSFLIRQHQKRH